MPEWNRGALIDVPPIKHICLVGTNRALVQRARLLAEERRKPRLEG